MAKAKKLPSGNWRVQAYHNGESRSFTAETRKEAEFLAAEWQTGRKEKAKPSNATVEDAITRYIEERSAILSPTTIADYSKLQRLYFLDLQSKKLNKVTQSDVQKEVNAMAARLSPKTIRNAVGFLCTACGFNFKLTLPKKEQKIYKTPGVDSIREIIEKTKGTPIEVPVLLALWCGLRMSEIRGLRWDHVFPDHIIVEFAIVDIDGAPVLKGPKNGIVRRIDIPRQLYDKIMTSPSTTDYVTNLTSAAIYKRFSRLTNGLCRFHDLRHANASVMMMLGIPDNVAMERGGWETERIYKKTYAQTMDESREKSAMKINEFFGNLIQ